MEGRRSQHVVRVAAVFSDYTDPGAYMNRAELHRLLSEGDRLSGAFISIDPNQIREFYAALKETPVLAGITVKEAAIQNFNDTIAANLRPMRLINAGFALVIALGVIYNCALITLAEQSRDFGTLRVLGFTRWEVSTVLLGELAVITLAAIPLGLPIGWGFSYLATLALDTETHRFPLVVDRATLAYATLVILGSATASALVVRRMLDWLDFISVLKVSE
jgi:putative ABC transport system permease protein